jgi:hypothetical protein
MPVIIGGDMNLDLAACSEAQVAHLAVPDCGELHRRPNTLPNIDHMAAMNYKDNFVCFQSAEVRRACLRAQACTM